MAARLSVLILSPHPTTAGGVSAYVEMLKNNLHNTEVTSFWVGANVQKKEKALLKLWRLIAAPLQIAFLSRCHGFDVIHIHPSLNFKSVLRDCLILLALICARQKRVFISFHGWDPEFLALISRHVFLRKIFVFLLNRSARISVLSPRFKQDLVQMRVIENKIILSRVMCGFGPSLDKDATATNRQFILFLSRFDPRKGAHELLQAYLRLAKDYPDYDLVLAGSGSEEQILRQLAAISGLNNRISFPGYVSGSAKQKLLEQCSLFALPTYYPEGMPIALIEAMAAGKPILATDAGGISSVIRNGENGLVLTKVSIDTVETGLRYLLNNPDLCDEIGQRNRVAAKQYEAAKVSAEIENLYFEIAQT